MYVLQEGIQPWEEAYRLPAATPLASLLVCARECSSLISLSNVLFGTTATPFSRLIRWYSTGLPLTDLVDNRLQQKRFLEEITVPPPGFEDACVDVPDQDSTPCVASYLVRPVIQEHVQALSLYRHTLLVLSSHTDLSLQDVCMELRPHAEGLGRSSLESICLRRSDWVLARIYYEEDSYCAWQIYGRRRKVVEMVGGLETLGAEGLRDLDRLVLFYTRGRNLKHWLDGKPAFIYSRCSSPLSRIPCSELRGRMPDRIATEAVWSPPGGTYGLCNHSGLALWAFITRSAHSEARIHDTYQPQPVLFRG